MSVPAAAPPMMTFVRFFIFALSYLVVQLAI
jgi:hypothetical protein